MHICPSGHGLDFQLKHRAFKPLKTIKASCFSVSNGKRDVSQAPCQGTPLQVTQAGDLGELCSWCPNCCLPKSVTFLSWFLELRWILLLVRPTYSPWVGAGAWAGDRMVWSALPSHLLSRAHLGPLFCPKGWERKACDGLRPEVKSPTRWAMCYADPLAPQEQSLPILLHHPSPRESPWAPDCAPSRGNSHLSL